MNNGLRYAAVSVASIVVGAAASLAAAGTRQPTVVERRVEVPGPERRVEVPGPERMVEVEVTPQSCLEALNIASEGNSINAEMLKIGAANIALVAAQDLSALQESKARMFDLAGQLRALIPGKGAATSACLAKLAPK